MPSSLAVSLVSEHLFLPLRPRPSPFSPRCCRRCHGNRRRLKLRGGLEGRARGAGGGAEQVGEGGKWGKTRGIWPESRRRSGYKPSGWSLLGKAKMPGAGQCGQRPHSLADWGVAEGQCGRGRGSEWAGSGRRRGLLEAGGRGLAYSTKGGGQRKGRGLRLGNRPEMRAGLTRQGRDVVPCAERRQGLRGLLSKKLRGAGVFGKENPGVGRSDVSVFLRWRPVRIPSEQNLLPQLYVPGRRLLGDSKVLDCCVARQRGNGKWREKGNGGWGRVL